MSQFQTTGFVVLIIVGLLICLLVRYLHQQILFYKSRAGHQQQEIALLQSEQQKLQHDIDELRANLQHAQRDPKTQLLGWTLFMEYVQQALAESARYQFSAALVFIDLDDFHTINQVLGDEIGDALLEAVAWRFQACLRQVDSLTRRAKDTFVVLLTQQTKQESAAFAVQRLLHALEQPIVIKEHSLHVTACAGIAVYPADGDSAAVLLRHAEHALQLAKAKGTQVYEFDREETQVTSERHFAIATGLRQEALLKELYIYYQPLKNISDGIYQGMDVILYWQHADLGLIHPDEWQTHAEKQGQLSFVTEWLIQNACRHFLRWQKDGVALQFLSFPVLLSQLENSHAVYRISQILQQINFKPEWLVLNLKLGTTTFALERYLPSINRLQYLGVKLALADFGVSTWTLHDIRFLPIQYLRLPASLWRGFKAEKLAHLEKFMMSIVALAASLSVQLIVQGVDSEANMQWLKKVGCTLMQGEWIALPMQEQEVVASTIEHLEKI